MVWYSHLSQNFPQFIVIHTVKGFGIVNKADRDVFLKLASATAHKRGREALSLPKARGGGWEELPYVQEAGATCCEFMGSQSRTRLSD